VELKQPKAAIQAAQAALQRNPDSKEAFKWMGKAHAMLGNWIDA
jgi:cytochrome c-type biogenesis protein CcmH/NrfG